MRRPTRTRRLAPLAVLLLPLATGCGDGIAQPESASVASAEFQSGEEVPFHLRGDAVLVAQVPAPDFGPPAFGKSDFGGRCSEPSDLLVSFRMWGEATHLGRYSAEVSDCTRIDFPTGAFEWSDGEIVYTAANGDRLYATFEGHSPGPGQGFDDEQHTFVGGTGRFAGATGHAVAVGGCDMATGTCALVMNGSISY